MGPTRTHPIVYRHKVLGIELFLQKKNPELYVGFCNEGNAVKITAREIRENYKYDKKKSLRNLSQIKCGSTFI